MKPIAGIQPPPRPLAPLETFGKPSVNTKPNSGIQPFAELMTEQVREVNTMQTDANDLVHSLLTGGDVNEAEVLTAVQKADLAFRMLLQVRNKLIEAYREIQQIQI
jgi:flagellar hook-basal body complex protein FliE